MMTSTLDAPVTSTDVTPDSAAALAGRGRSRYLPDAATHSAERTSHVLAALDELAPTIRAAATEIDETRLVPDEIIGALYDIGVFRTMMPLEVGGLELEAPDYLRVVEATAGLDGSLGWLAMINCGLTFLPPDTFRELVGDDKRWIAGLNAGRMSGTATRVEGGYQVSGRWPFASGSPYADFGGGMALLVDDEGRPVIHPGDGQPWVVLGVVPKEDLTLIDTWNGLGMRGTGSGDIALDDVFIPEDRTMQSLKLSPYAGALYRCAMMFQISGHGAHALGVARAAVDDFVAACNKVPAAGSRRQLTLGKLQHQQMAVAKADALIRSARAFLVEVVTEAYETCRTLSNGEVVPLEQRVLMREATTHAVQVAREATTLVFNALGAGAVRKGTVIERAYRDATTAAMHIVHTEDTLSLSGQYWITKDRENGPEIDGGIVAFF